MQHRYSIVISPPDVIIALVKSMKEALAEEIGWFHSKNSLAHITINEFMATDSEFEGIKEQLFSVCAILRPIEVYFDHYDNYPNGAFFIAPETHSKRRLEKIIRKIHQSLQLEPLFQNNEAHISVGRRLKPKEIAVAYILFPSIDMHFVCDSITLRRFNPKIKQFEIINRFDFNTASGPPL
jgi:2'-5' RNA ligase